MNWKPISTAPKDGTVILTDCGLVSWSNNDRYYDSIQHEWFLCYPDGTHMCDCDYGPFPEKPNIWTEFKLPEAP